MTRIGMATALALAIAGSASANLIADGGFEEFIPQQLERVPAGGWFGAWHVEGDGEDHVDVLYDSIQAPEGNQYAIMRGVSTSGGILVQQVELVPGQSYELSVFAGGIPNEGTCQLTLEASTSIGEVLIDPSSPGNTPIRWDEYAFTFTAAQAEETLRIYNSRQGLLVVDDVQLVLVPEPISALLLVLAGLLWLRPSRRRVA